MQVVVESTSVGTASVGVELAGVVSSACEAVGRLDGFGVSGEVLSLSFGVEMDARTTVAFLDVLEPVLDLRVGQRLAAGGRRRVGAAGAGPNAEFVAAVENYPTAVRDRLLQPGDRPAVLKDLFGQSAPTLAQLRAVVHWSADPGIPALVRDGVCDLIAAYDRGALKVAGLHRRAAKLVAPHLTGEEPAPAVDVVAERRVTALVNLVTGAEKRLSSWCAEGLVDAIRADPGGQATLLGVLGSVERVLAQLRTVQEELSA